MARNSRRNKPFEKQRRKNLRPDKKRFVIATEGKETEPQYFLHLKNKLAKQVDIDILQASGKGDSAPLQVKKRAKDYLADKTIDEFNPETDELWLVVDVDNHKHQHLNELFEFCQNKQGYHLAISNRCFEYWILLHFKFITRSFSSYKQIKQAVRKHLPKYSKSNICMNILKDKINDALANAQKQSPDILNADWPGQTGTHVHRLVAKLREFLENNPR